MTPHNAVNVLQSDLQRVIQQVWFLRQGRRSQAQPHAPVSNPASGASSNLKSSQGKLQAAKSATLSGPSVRQFCRLRNHVKGNSINS